jgi:phage terminase large subunit
MLNPNLKSFWLTKARFKVLYGGRSASKSHDAAGMSILLAREYRVNFLCARQFQNRIEDSVYTLLKAKIVSLGFENEFEVLNNKITHLKTGSEFKFYGLWRNIEEIKSLEGIDVLWLEEAHNITKEQMDILEPTIRKNSSEIWILFNPRLATDYVYKEFVINKRSDSVVRKINYTENPFNSETILKTIQDLKEKDFDDYLHIYEGQPLTNDESSVIRRKWIEAAIDAHKKIPISGIRQIGFDVADDGSDNNAEVVNLDGIITSCDEWRGGEDGILDSCKRVYLSAHQNNCSIAYDPIGVGAACGGKFRELNERGGNINYKKFIAGAAVDRPDVFYANRIKNKDMFLNLKAQAWWELADKFKNTYNFVVNGIQSSNVISLSSEISNLEKLIEELSTPRKKFAENGKLKVESKEDLAKRGIKSPNLADALVMSCYAASDVGNFSKPKASQSGNRKDKVRW